LILALDLSRDILRVDRAAAFVVGADPSIVAVSATPAERTERNRRCNCEADEAG
jgi:hypothetical protein